MCVGPECDRPGADHQNPESRKDTDMTEHTITVNGHVYTFEVHPYPEPDTDKALVVAPGVVEFDVRSIDEARDILHGIYERQALV